MLRAFLTACAALLLLAGTTGCKSERKKTLESSAQQAVKARKGTGEKKRGRFGLEQRTSQERAHAANTESEDEHTEHDGGPTAKAPPRPDFSKVASERSYSIGTPNGGWLMGGRTMALKTPYYRILPRTERRGWYYGGEELVAVIAQAAKSVATQFPGAMLRVGNLSRKEGGKIGTSVSHQSGRDADIGLYCTDLDNVAVDPPRFPEFVEKGNTIIDRSGQYLFDTERNWAFVAALLSDPKARVQWIFLDTPLKYAMINFAIRQGASAELVEKAEKVIMRPANSSPHAEHFHLRIFCTPRDLQYDCKDYGPEWGWVKEERKKNEEQLQQLVDRVMNGEKGLLSMDGSADAPVPVLDNQPAPEPKQIPAPIPVPPSTGGTPKYERANLPTTIQTRL